VNWVRKPGLTLILAKDSVCEGFEGCEENLDKFDTVSDFTEVKLILFENEVPFTD